MKKIIETYALMSFVKYYINKEKHNHAHTKYLI
jgi:hypothetical protein